MRRSRQAAHTHGMDAEQQCAQALRKKGYRVLGERVRTAAGEIDIVAALGDVLVIVEVKARGTELDALESVNLTKRRRLTRATEALIAGAGVTCGLDLAALPPNIRFDVMAVIPQRPLVHIEDAWRPDETGF